MSETISRLFSSAPVNAQASKTLRMRGEDDIRTPLSESDKHWDAPPPTTVPPPGAPDYSGARRGKMTIIGYLGSGKKDGCGAKWLARCVCGQYEVRRPKSIKANNQHDRCRRCYHIHRVKRQAFFDARGRWPDENN